LTPLSSIRLQRLSSVLPRSHLRFVLSTGVSQPEVTFDVQLLKEQNKYDQMPSSLLDQLQRVSPLAEKVANEVISEGTEILDKIIPQMFEVMQRIAKFLCEYVKRGRFSRLSLFWIPQMLIIPERTGDVLVHSKDKEMMEMMGEELSNVIEDFLRAVDVETLRLAKRSGKHSLFQYRASAFSVVSCRASRARSSTQAA
jgi:hypothetical protein